MTAVQKPINGRKFVTFSQGKIAARKYAREQARLRNSLSRGFQKKLLTVFNRTIKKATESLNNQQIPQIGVISQSFQEELTATVKTQVRRVYSTIYEANYKRYQEVSQKAEGDPFDFRRSADFERAVGMYFLGRENMMVGITDTTARQILDRIEKLRGEDNTLDQIARQLPKEFAQVNRRRANVIARTETHSAAGYANHDYYSQASDSYGIQMLKQWVATSDARTRQQHSLMNGAKVPMDEDFIMPNGARMGFTGDSKGGAVHVINCRCVTLYHEPEDIVDDVADIQQQEEFDFDDVINTQGPRIGIKNKEYAEYLLNNTSADGIALAKLLPKPTEFIQKRRTKKGKRYTAGFYRTYSSSGRKEISSDIKELTFIHEYGHHIDYQARVTFLRSTDNKAWSQSNDAFKAAWSTDRVENGFKLSRGETYRDLAGTWKERLSKLPPDEANLVSDILDSFARGELYNSYGFFGHGVGYYSNVGMRYKETFANLYALQDKGETWKSMKGWFPELTALYEKQVKEWIGD
jgi:hypothetical protein